MQASRAGRPDVVDVCVDVCAWFARRPSALVALVAVLAYAMACGGTFVYDDIHSVRDNRALRDLGNLARFFVDPGLFSDIESCRMYRPVLLCTYAFDWQLGGGAAFVFKLTNLLLHTGCAVALHAIALRLGASALAACLAAALFAAHPLASEAVNMVSGRSEVLMLFGMLLGIVCWFRARFPTAQLLAAQWPGQEVATSTSSPSRGLLRALPIALLAGVSCGSKETGVLLPVLLVALELVHRRGTTLRASLVRLLPTAGIVTIYLLARRAVLGIATASLPLLQNGTDVQIGHGRDLVTQLCTMAVVLPRCLAQALVPVGMTLDPYVPFQRDPWQVPVLCGALLLLVLTVLGLRARARAVRVGTLLAWACSLPWVVLPLNHPLCEHRLYGLLAGLALISAEALGGTLGAASRVPRLAVAGIAIATFTVLAALRSSDYRDETVLWQKVLDARPYSVQAHTGLALKKLESQDFLGARPLLERAVSLYPAHFQARKYLAITNLRLPPGEAQPFTALTMIEGLVARAPRDPFLRLLLAECAMAVGQLTEDPRWHHDAERHALACLEIAAPKGLVYLTAARACEQRNDLAAALAHLDTAVARGLASIAVRLARAELLQRLDRRREAQEELAAALRQDPFDPAVMQAVRAAGRATAPR